MPINSADLYKIATELWKDRREVSQRSAISRAYYAAYHEAKAWHCNLPEPGTMGNAKGGSHDILIHQLANPMGRTKRDSGLQNQSKRFANELQRLRALRNAADYDINDVFDDDDHFTLLIEVKQLLTDMGVHFPPPVTSPSLAPTTPAPSHIP